MHRSFASLSCWNRQLGVLLAAAVLLLGCTVRPFLAKRYDEWKPGRPEPCAGVSVRATAFALSPPAPSSDLNFTSIPEKAQAALIAAVAAEEEFSSAEKLLELLATPMTPARRRPAIENRSRVTRRLVLSLEHTPEDPADRVTSAVFTLVPDSGTSFLSWDRFESKQERIELGTVAFQGSAELALPAVLEPESISDLTKASPSRGFARKLAEEIRLSEIVTSLSGSLTPKEARIVRRGSRLRDLTDNVAVDLTFSTHSDFANTARVAGPTPGTLPRSQADSTLTQQLIQFIARSPPLEATLTVDYVVRQVVRGGETYLESDDKVRYCYGESRAETVVLADEDSTQSVFWQLAGYESERSWRLATAIIPGVPEEGDRAEALLFGSPEHAGQVLAWLRNPDVAWSPQGASHGSIGRLALFLCPNDEFEDTVRYFDALSTCRPLARDQVSILELEALLYGVALGW